MTEGYTAKLTELYLNGSASQAFALADSLGLTPWLRLMRAHLVVERHIQGLCSRLAGDLRRSAGITDAEHSRSYDAAKLELRRAALGALDLEPYPAIREVVVDPRSSIFNLHLTIRGENRDLFPSLLSIDAPPWRSCTLDVSAEPRSAPAEASHKYFNVSNHAHRPA